MRARAIVVLALLLTGLAAAGLRLREEAQVHPENFPWTGLDLRQPIGVVTGRKLGALADEPGRCGALLAEAGVRYAALPPRRDRPECGYDQAIRFQPGSALPADIGAACPVAAALVLFEREVVQPAALRHLGREVTAFDHFGAYNCRRLYNRGEGPWSEHARANALDLAGFRLAGGGRVTVLADWADPGAKGRFLREVRDGACRLFATVLSPDYNAAHRDHFHLDQARRGSICR